MRQVLIVLTLFACTCAAAAQSPPAEPVIEEVYLARDNGEGKPGDQVTEFGPNDIPIHCVVLLGTIGSTLVKMNFVAVNVAGVKLDTKVVTASYKTTEGQNRVNFSGRPDGKWTPGRYRVDLFVNGKLEKTIEFEIKGAGAGVTPSNFVQNKSKPNVRKPQKP